MKYLIGLGFILTFSFGICNAQIKLQDSEGEGQEMKNNVHQLIENTRPVQDSRIDSLLILHQKINEKRKGTEGYRLEIFFSSSNNAREEALRIKSEFLNNYPELPAYLQFQTPNFKLRIGDFRTRSEALKVKEKIKREFPNAFIVKDIIRFPELYTESKDQ